MTRNARYTVRKRTSGYDGGVSFIVWDTERKSRVSVVPNLTRQQAQASADDLNIGDMVRPHAEDPRPYAERRAEAERIYRDRKASGRSIDSHQARA
jgi:hypothetical protein